jgi:hypothetical protein
MCPQPVDLPVDRLEDFASSKIRWQTIRLMGGEPLLYPHLSKAFDILERYRGISRVELATNGLLLSSTKIPGWIHVISSKKSIDKNPMFETFNFAPIDYGVSTGFENGCWIPRECGMSLSADGLYYSCGAGAAVSRFFNLNLGKNTPELVGNPAPACRFCGHFLYDKKILTKLTNVQVWSKSWTR